MFDKEELQHIMNCVEAPRSPNTEVARRKANIITKVCDELESIEKNEAERKKKAEAKKK